MSAGGGISRASGVSGPGGVLWGVGVCSWGWCALGEGGVEGSASGTGGVSQHAMGQTHPTVNRIVGTSF